MGYKHGELKNILTKEFLYNQLELKKHTLGKLAKKINCNHISIRNYAIKYNINYNKENIAGRIYKEVDLDLFKYPTSDIFYFLGFLAADGNITNNTIRFEISSKDMCILKYIKKLLNISNPITKTYNNLIQLNFTSKSLIRYLTRFSLLPNKTYVLEYPKNLNKEQTRHFIRGFFDGDGCVTYDKTRRYKRLYGPKAIFFTVCSKSFVNDLTKNLIKYGIDAWSKKRYNGSRSKVPIYKVFIGYKSIKDFHKFLYDGANFYLLRKEQRLSNIIKYRQLRKESLNKIYA